MSARDRTVCSSPPIVRGAIRDSFRKLDPRAQLRNPVMFVVVVGSALHHRARRGRLARAAPASSAGVHPGGLGLALVHRAVRQLRRGDGRGARQGAGRRAARPRASAPPPRLVDVADRNAPFEIVPSTALRKGDLVARRGRRDDPRRRRGRRGRRLGQRERGHRRERAGDPRERRRSQRGHRRHPGALRLARGAGHRRSRRDLPRPDDRAGRGREAQEDAQRDRARHPARRADPRLPARLRPRCCRSRSTASKAAGAGLADHAHRPGGAAGLPDPDHHRRPALGDRHRGHGPHDPAPTSSPPRAAPSRRPATSTCCCSTRPARSRSATGRRRPSFRRPGIEAGARRGRAARLARRRDARGAQHRRARQGALRPPRARGPQPGGRLRSRSPPRRA